MNIQGLIVVNGGLIFCPDSVVYFVVEEGADCRGDPAPGYGWFRHVCFACFLM